MSLIVKLFERIGWWRFSSVIFLGIIVNFIVDLIFGLLYRNYHIARDPSSYLGAILLAFLILEGIRLINVRLDLFSAWDANPARRFIIQVTTNIGYVLVVMVGLRMLINLMLLNVTYIRFSDEVVIIFTTIVVSFIAVLTDLGMFLLKKWRVSLSELERFKKENIEFQFEMLKNQVNPHFLFNSLNTLSSLIYTDKDVAAKFVRQLAKVYRYVLENRDKEVITLQDEVTFLESYIYLVDLRFGKGLTIEVDIPEAVHAKYIAPMTLQMLLENAIKHNIVSPKNPLTIRIELTEQNALLVTNNLQPKSFKEYSSHLGLKNIHSRYGFITDRKVEVKQTDAYFQVSIPLLDKL